MATQLKNWPKTTTTKASDDWMALDGNGNGTRRILADSLEADFASSYENDPATFNLATLVGGKVPASQLNLTGFLYQGNYDAGTNTPALTDATGTQNHIYRVTNSANPTAKDFGGGSQNLNDDEYIAYAGVSGSGTWDNIGSGNLQQINEGGTGATTIAGAQTALEVMSNDGVNDRFLDRAPSNAIVLGNNGYAAPAGALSTTALQDNFAICISFRLNSLSASLRMIGMLTSGATGSSSNQGSIRIETDGEISYRHYDGTYQAVSDVISAADMVLDRVYHIIYRVDSAAEGLTPFVNGKKGSVVATGAASGASLRWQFGTSDYDGSGIEILGYKILNYAPSDADCVLWSKRSAVPLADQWGKADQVTNGAFASDSNWIKGAGWTISGGTASCASGSTDIEQSNFASAVAGETYRVTFDVANYSSGTVQARLGSTGGTARSANGTYTQDIVYSAGTNLGFRSASFVGDIDNVTLELLGVTDSGQPGNIMGSRWVDESSNDRDLAFTVAQPLMVQGGRQLHSPSSAATDAIEEITSGSAATSIHKRFADGHTEQDNRVHVLAATYGYQQDIKSSLADNGVLALDTLFTEHTVLRGMIMVRQRGSSGEGTAILMIDWVDNVPTIVGDVGSVWTQTKDSASKFNIYLDAGNSNKPTIQNKMGFSAEFSFTAFFHYRP